MTTTCNCVVVSHPAGEVWIPDGPCNDHRHAQPFTEEIK
jgi:hypothetical protein